MKSHKCSTKNVLEPVNVNVKLRSIFTVPKNIHIYILSLVDDSIK